MFIHLSKRKGQSILEYAVLIGVVVAGLIGMQIYLKRGLQGGIKKSSDSIGGQFDPMHTTYSSTSNSSSNTVESLDNTGLTTSNVIMQTSNRSGTENVEAITATQNLWDR